MKLRKLKQKDAPLMLEWMHDSSVTCNLFSNFSDKTLADCKKFIANSIGDNFIHLAIVSDNDEYMGTVSLKRIDRINNRAEFAIAVRTAAMGRGFSWFGMKEMIKIAFEKENLNMVYWCVSGQNTRACRFYDKHKFEMIKEVDELFESQYIGVRDLKWYGLSRDDFSLTLEHKSTLYKTVSIRTFGESGKGKLSFLEELRDFPFTVKRMYFIHDVDEGVKRGFHAHKHLKQILFCPFGKILLLLDNGIKKEECLLDNPSLGVLIDKPVWREMVWLEKKSVLCVLASDYYDESDYIRDYKRFLEFMMEDDLK